MPICVLIVIINGPIGWVLILSNYGDIVMKLDYANLERTRPIYFPQYRKFVASRFLCLNDIPDIYLILL